MNHWPETDGNMPGCNVQSEVSLAATGSTVVAAWNDGAGCDDLIRNQFDQANANLSLNGYAWSDDGGRTWADRGEVPPIPGGNLGGDPVLAAGPDGTVYYASIGRLPPQPGAPIGNCANPANGRFGPSIIAVARSNGAERRFQTPVVASIGRDPCVYHDKPWIAVDRSTDSPHVGTVYVGWTEVQQDSTDQPPTWTMLVARSRTGGASFEAPFALTTDPRDAYFGIQLAVGPQGHVYALWPDSETHLFVARSVDQGKTFQLLPGPATRGWFMVARAIGRLQRACIPDSFSLAGNRVMNGDIRVHTWPSMAIDVSGSSDPFAPDHNPLRGRMYVAIPSFTQTGDEGDIAFIYSSDGGLTWQNIQPSGGLVPTVLLNEDGSSGGKNGQFHPSVAVDSRANVLVSWYDRRNGDVPGDPVPDHRTDWLIDVYARISSDGGKTFGPEVKVTDGPFPPAQNNPNASPLTLACYMGDYNAVIPTDDGFLLGWGDNRDADPTTGLPDPNVYTDIVGLGAPGGPPLQFPGKAKAFSSRRQPK